MKILIVEDDPLLQKAMSYAFTSEENKIFSAKNGMEALEIVEENQKMDLIICDIMMPVVSGVTFMSLFNHHPFKDTPIIVISALNNGEEFLKKHDIVFNHFLSKPFDIARLKELVNSFDKK